MAEEDLHYFENLIGLDLSDNRVRLEQLKNLKALLDLNLSYNRIGEIPLLQAGSFPNLEVLNLSYNKLSHTSVLSLYNLQKLRVLDLTANELQELPHDLSKLTALEDLNLSANLFSNSQHSIPAAFKYLSGLPHLKRLNISRNKFTKFHSELLNPQTDFLQLQDLDFSFNLVDREENLWYITQTKSINLIVITGNPLASSSTK